MSAALLQSVVDAGGAAGSDAAVVDAAVAAGDDDGRPTD